MNTGEKNAYDSATLVPQVGRLLATGNPLDPYRLVDPDGTVLKAVSTFFADLQAAGRSPATVRSYGMDLLRWFRFLWTVGVGWDRATRSEAREFSRLLQVAPKPVRPHWRKRGHSGGEATVSRPGKDRYALSVRAHSETVLRSFYEFHREAGTGPMVCSRSRKLHRPDHRNCTGRLSPVVGLVGW